VFPGDLTDTRFTPTKSASAGHRIGALTRAEMRRGIILREILDKPLALRDLPE
jgi:hypothetical protein